MTYQPRETQEQMPDSVPVKFSVILDADHPTRSRLSFLNGAPQKTYTKTLDVNPNLPQGVVSSRNGSK